MTEGATPLQSAAELARLCDERATHWQTLHFRFRMAVLLLGLATALLGAVVTSLGLGGTTVGFVVKAATVFLPLTAAGLTAVLGTLNMAKKWVAYRAAAETLKTEAYLYAAAAANYSGGDRDDALRRRLEQIRAELAEQTGERPRGA